MDTIFLVSTILLWVVVLFNLLLTLALIRRVNAQPAKTTTPHRLISLAAGTPAPPFEAQTMTGDPVTLEAYRGRPTFFAFVTPTCAACRDVFPLLQQAAASSVQTTANIVVVSGADHQQTRRIIEEFALTVPVIVAPAETSTFFKDYKVTGTPSYCFIDEKGMVKEAGHLSPTSLAWKTLVVA